MTRSLTATGAKALLVEDLAVIEVKSVDPLAATIMRRSYHHFERVVENSTSRLISLISMSYTCDTESSVLFTAYDNLGFAVVASFAGQVSHLR